MKVNDIISLSIELTYKGESTTAHTLLIIKSGKGEYTFFGTLGESYTLKNINKLDDVDTFFKENIYSEHVDISTPFGYRDTVKVI